jgi:cobalt-precorrin-5B (C1)-methyltransferase
MKEYGCDRGIRITIEIPEGVELAERTFNPRLGIEGGISVLGTSGIVEPMSEEALKATIRAELSVRRAEGYTDVTLVPGNYGLDFLREKYGREPEEAVKCSNFIGDAIDAAVSFGFMDILLVGHIGKFIKLSGGIFQTHSSQADARIDLLVSAGVRAGISTEILCPLFSAVTTEDALRILHEKNVLAPVMDEVKKRIDYYLARRTAGKVKIEVILFSTVLGEL